jgi:hypothetical protein
MEYTEAEIREFVSRLVLDALADSPPAVSVKFAQGRFVKTDPASVICTWQPPAPGGTTPSREFTVIFSGDALAAFVAANPEQLAKHRATAIASIQSGHKDFEQTGDNSARPVLCLIDKFEN